MIVSDAYLKKLITSGLVVGEYLTAHQASLLDKAFLWSEVEQAYPQLEPGMLSSIYYKESTLTEEVYLILMELGAGEEEEEEDLDDLWL